MPPEPRAYRWESTSDYVPATDFIGSSLSSDNLVSAIETLRGTNDNPYQPSIENMGDTIKLRHLNQDERADLHNPAIDWRESSRGEELRHSARLKVLDILTKHKIKHY